MDIFNNKTAFISGAAPGIGLTLASALLQRGANVMMADIDAVGLELAAKNLPDYDACLADLETSD